MYLLVFFPVYIGHLFFKQMRNMTLTEMEPLKIHLDSLEMAGKMVDKHIIADSNFPSLTNLMRYSVQGKSYIIIIGKNNFENTSM